MISSIAPETVKAVYCRQDESGGSSGTDKTILNIVPEDIYLAIIIVCNWKNKQTKGLFHATTFCTYKENWVFFYLYPKGGNFVIFTFIGDLTFDTIIMIQMINSMIQFMVQFEQLSYLHTYF